jgi:hypothetical protein
VPQLAELDDGPALEPGRLILLGASRRDHVQPNGK